MGDCVEQPHVHVTGNGGNAKLWLSPIAVARVRSYNDHQLEQVLAITRTHQNEWLGRWNEECK